MILRSSALAAVVLCAPAMDAGAAANTIEGDLVPISSKRAGNTSCGKYFIVRKLKDGSDGGIAFEVRWVVAPNTTILTAIERVRVVVDDKKPVPWASVETDTGRFHTVIHISSAELARSPCLANAKRA